MANIDKAIVDVQFEEENKRNELEGFLYQRGVLEDIFKYEEELSDDDTTYKYEFEEVKLEDEKI